MEKIPLLPYIGYQACHSPIKPFGIWGLALFQTPNSLSFLNFAIWDIIRILVVQ